MRLYILFSLIICISTAKVTKDECFNIEENYVLNQTTLQIKGNGRMCDCNGEELKEYRDSIDLILFEDSMQLHM